MILKDYLPAPPLREFVQCYRIIHFAFDESHTPLFKAYPPKPEAYIHFTLKGRLHIESPDRQATLLQVPVALFGQQTSVIPRYNDPHLFLFQIVFQPSALFRLTGIPAIELTNRHLPAADIFTSIPSTYQALQEAHGYGELLRLADCFVQSLVSNIPTKRHPIEGVINLMIESAGSASVDWLAKESALCTKQFARKFAERVGVNPRTYGRIIRFTQAYHIKNARPDWDWLKIAIACNYYDYQHLVRDYKSFTGLAPTAFHLLESNSPECKAGIAGDLYQERFLSVCDRL